MKEYKIRDLTSEEIECRIGKITAKGLTLLLYKTARTDIKILKLASIILNSQVLKKLKDIIF